MTSLDIGQGRFYQTGDPIDYCRRFNGATFDDYDAEAISIAGTPVELMADAADFVYVGKDSTFSHVGFEPDTAGDYGAITTEYWNDAWVALTVLGNSTISGGSTFAKLGYFYWSIPGDWALTTIDGQSAFWIRVSVASAATPATMLNLLEPAQAEPPFVKDDPDTRQRNIADTNSTLRKRDLNFTGPNKLFLDCTNITFTWAEMQLIWKWWKLQETVTFVDGAKSVPLDLANDAFINESVGKFFKTPPKVESPAKQAPESFTLDLDIESVNTVLHDLGVLT